MGFMACVASKMSVQVDLLEPSELTAICKYFSEHIPETITSDGKAFLLAAPIFPTWGLAVLPAKESRGIWAEDRTGSSCCNAEALPIHLKASSPWHTRD